MMAIIIIGFYPIILFVIIKYGSVVIDSEWGMNLIVCFTAFIFGFIGTWVLMRFIRLSKKRSIQELLNYKITPCKKPFKITRAMQIEIRDRTIEITNRIVSEQEELLKMLKEFNTEIKKSTEEQEKTNGE